MSADPLPRRLREILPSGARATAAAEQGAGGSQVVGVGDAVVMALLGEEALAGRRAVFQCYADSHGDEEHHPLHA